MAMTTPIKRDSVPYDLKKLGSDWSLSRDGSCAVFAREIVKSPNDVDRSYRLIRLSNGLSAMLVSDPTTDKAAASLSVGVGHLSDPDDLPGLAHFCEHMLFLGTERFPEEDAYKTYLSRNNGSSNASTSMDETNYYFTVHPSGLEGALERHSQFFTAPLFLPSCTEREVNAVDSEFRRNLQLDSRRLFQLGKATSSRTSGSPYWKFGTGSIETLWHRPRARGEDVRQRLLDWYAEHYSANRMTLCVVSNQTLDELQAFVQKHYSAVSNLDLPKLTYPGEPLTSEELQRVVFYRTLKNVPQMRLIWPFEDQKPLWQSRPGRMISHYIGHEGQGSILSLLKKRGWATSLSSGAGGGASGFAFFTVDVSLTPEGLESWQSVMHTIQLYIATLRTEGPQRWAFEEERKLGEIGWRFAEKGQPGSVAQDLASRLHMPYDLDKMLVAPRFPVEYDEQAVRREIDMLVPSRCKVMLGSQEPLSGIAWDLKEEHYGTEHSIAPLPIAKASPFANVVREVLTRKAKQLKPTDELHLPGPNPFIPSHLEVVSKKHSGEPAKRPSLIRQTSMSRLFFKRDDTWLVPRANANFHLKTPVADATPLDAIKTQLVTALLEETLNEYSYFASLAGLHYSVGSSSEGLEIFVSGYSEKLETLLKVVADKLRSLDFSDEQYNMVHNRLCRAYANAKLSNPSSLADVFLRHAVSQTNWTWDERLDALQHVTPVDVKTHVPRLLAKLDIDALVHGNLLKEDAIHLMKTVEECLGAQAADPSDHDFHRALVVPNGRNFVLRAQVPAAENVNSAASVYYSIGPVADDELNCRVDLFAEIARVPIFSTLRTKEQLGYIVSSGVMEACHHAGFRVIVQSERTAEYLEERIEDFWRSFEQRLQEMTQEQFEEQKQALINKRLEKPKNLNQESSRYYNAIEDGALDFFWRDRHAKIISNLTRDDMLSFYNRYISPSAKQRGKISVLMRSQRFQPASLADLSKALADAGVDESRVNELVKSKPTLSAIEAFAESNQSEIVSKAIDDLRQMPELTLGQEEVSSLEDLKKHLSLGPRREPIDDFTSDLQSHL